MKWWWWLRKNVHMLQIFLVLSCKANKNNKWIEISEQIWYKAGKAGNSSVSHTTHTGKINFATVNIKSNAILIHDWDYKWKLKNIRTRWNSPVLSRCMDINIMDDSTSSNISRLSHSHGGPEKVKKASESDFHFPQCTCKLHCILYCKLQVSKLKWILRSMC